MTLSQGYQDGFRDGWPDRQSVRPESVTQVLRMNCYPCVRNGPSLVGGRYWT